MKHSYIIAFWSPFPITATDFCMDFFSSFFHRHGDIQCVLCNSDQKERTIRILLHADLMVVVFHQSYRELCRWITDDIYRFANCLYMIIDYFPEKDYSLIRISQDFRIPLSRLTCIPYNLKYREASRRGAVRSYWRSCTRHGICQAGMDFYGELLRSARMMLKSLGE